MLYCIHISLIITVMYDKIMKLMIYLIKQVFYAKFAYVYVHCVPYDQAGAVLLGEKGIVVRGRVEGDRAWPREKPQIVFLLATSGMGDGTR